MGPTKASALPSSKTLSNWALKFSLSRGHGPTKTTVSRNRRTALHHTIILPKYGFSSFAVQKFESLFNKNGVYTVEPRDHEIPTLYTKRDVRNLDSLNMKK